MFTISKSATTIGYCLLMCAFSAWATEHLTAFPSRIPANAPTIPQRCQRVAEYVTRLDLGMSTDPARPNLPTRRNWAQCIPSESELNGSSATDLENRVRDCAITASRANLPWALLESSRLEILRAGYLVMFRLAHGMLLEKGALGSVSEITPPAQAVESVLAALSQDGSVDLSASSRAVFGALSTRSGFGSESLANLLASRLCRPYSSASCPEAFRDILHRFPVYSMRTGGMMGMPRLLGEFLSDPINARAAARAALRIMRHVREVEAGRPVTRHFFEDIRDSYLELGLGEVPAITRTWDFLTVYSLQGAAIHWFAPAFTRNNAPFAAALYMIAAGVGYLDGFSFGESSRYSLPPEVESNCIYGKPYHFWLSAALARSAALTIPVDSRSASAGAHLAAIGYEYDARTWGRSDRISSDSDRDSVYLDSVRLNIAFSDAGAVYGARTGTGRRQSPIHVDDGISELIRNWHETGFFSTFFGWRENFGADAAWNYFIR